MPSYLVRLGLALGLVASYLCATTYPFEWLLEGWRLNGAQQLEGRAIFPGNGALVAANSSSWLGEIVVGNAIAVTMQVMPRSTAPNAGGALLSVANAKGYNNLTVVQQGRDLSIEITHVSQPGGERRPYVVPDVFSAEGAGALVSLSISHDILAVRVNGERRLEVPLPEFALFHWDLRAQLVLGNDARFERPWHGEISSMRVNTRLRDVDVLAAPLDVPGAAEFVARRAELMSGSPWDVIVNFLAMMPFGMLSMAVAARRRPWIVGAQWLAVCLLAEGLQMFLAARHTSLSDVCLNVAGVVAGSHLFAVVHGTRREWLGDLAQSWTTMGK